MDEEAPPLIAEKIGWQTKRLGLEKKRIPGCGRRVICWDEEKMRHLASRYGLSLDIPYPRKIRHNLHNLHAQTWSHAVKVLVKVLKRYGTFTAITLRLSQTVKVSRR